MLVTEIPSRYTDGDGVCPSDAVACELLVNSCGLLESLRYDNTKVTSPFNVHTVS